MKNIVQPPQSAHSRHLTSYKPSEKNRVGSECVIDSAGNKGMSTVRGMTCLYLRFP